MLLWRSLLTIWGTAHANTYQSNQSLSRIRTLLARATSHHLRQGANGLAPTTGEAPVSFTRARARRGGAQGGITLVLKQGAPAVESPSLGTGKRSFILNLRETIRFSCRLPIAYLNYTGTIASSSTSDSIKDQGSLPGYQWSRLQAEHQAPTRPFHSSQSTFNVPPTTKQGTTATTTTLSETRCSPSRRYRGV